MQDHERHSSAAMLIEAVRVNHNGAYDKWTKIDKNDSRQYQEWVRDVVGLKDLPTEDDLRAMHAHSRDVLKDRVQQMREAHPEGPVCAGACIAED